MTVFWIIKAVSLKFLYSISKSTFALLCLWLFSVKNSCYIFPLTKGSMQNSVPVKLVQYNAICAVPLINLLMQAYKLYVQV